MPFFTPRGLKIGFDIPFAFALIGRLYPKRTAFQVLKTTEGLEVLPSLLAFVAAIAVMVLSPSLLGLSLGIIVGRLVGVFMIEQVSFVPGLPRAATLMSWITGFGLLWGTLIVLSFATLGWYGLLTCAASWLVSILLDKAIELWLTFPRSKLTKMGFTRAELEFYLAYRLHAHELGVADTWSLSDEELDSGKWVECLQDYAKNYPGAVQRFAQDYYAVISDVRGATEWQKREIKRQRSAP